MTIRILYARLELTIFQSARTNLLDNYVSFSPKTDESTTKDLIQKIKYLDEGRIIAKNNLF